MVKVIIGNLNRNLRNHERNFSIHDLFSIQLVNNADNICPNRKRREEKREQHFYKHGLLCQKSILFTKNG